MSKRTKLAAIIVVCIVAISIVAVTTIYPSGCQQAPMSEPHLVTGSCADQAATSLKAQGEVTGDGGADVTRRGFYYHEDPVSGLEFDGSNYVSAGTLASYGSVHMAEGTIELWIKAKRALGLTDHRGVITTSEPDVTNYWGIWTIRQGEALEWVTYFGVQDDDYRYLEGYAGEIAIDDDRWHHVAVTWNCATDTIEIYVDGTSRTVTYLNQERPSSFRSFTEDVLIGSDRWGGLFVGVLGDVRVWTTIRTEQEINDNKDRMMVGDEAGLFAYWRLDEGQGDTAYDSTVNNHDGSLVGDPEWFVGGDIVDETGEFGTGTYSLDMTGLQPDTWYWIRAFAENEGGSGYGNVVRCKTLEAA